MRACSERQDVTHFTCRKAAFSVPHGLHFQWNCRGRRNSILTDRARDKSSRGPDNLGLQDTVRLSATGLAKVLGDLEARVLRTVWELSDPATAREVHTRVFRRHKVELLTVITVLNKLVAKGILSRAKQDDLLHYSACYTEEEFMTMASRRVVEGILSLGAEAVSASLVDVLAERDPEQLAELGRLIRRRLRAEGKE